jgi:hypothetical protein
MSVFRLQSFLEWDVPNEYCREVDVKVLAEQYKNETGGEPVMIVDGNSFLRKISECSCYKLMLEGQISEFLDAIKNFVAAFQNIGVRVVFFFDGPPEEKEMRVWLDRRKN